MSEFFSSTPEMIGSCLLDGSRLTLRSLLLRFLEGRRNFPFFEDLKVWILCSRKEPPLSRWTDLPQKESVPGTGSVLSKRSTYKQEVMNVWMLTSEKDSTQTSLRYIPTIPVRTLRKGCDPTDRYWYLVWLNLRVFLQGDLGLIYTNLGWVRRKWT